MVHKRNPSDADKTAGLFDHHLANSVRESATQIWLAGLGAFAKAQEEGGKVFNALVKEGSDLQRKTQAAAEEHLGDVGQRVSGMASEVSSKAGQQWDKLESIFEERTARAMGKLGMPSAKDIEALKQRIDDLTAQVGALSKAAAAKTARPRASAKASAGGATKPAGKASAKRTAARKSTP